MRPLMAGICAVGVCASVVLPASAGWDNVFQPTLFGRHRQPAVSNYYAPPVIVQSSPIVAAPVVAQYSPCDTCPQPQCTTNYVQRCYYQPVTTYQNKTVYEQVTTYRTSYYYEPVTSYRYSCYYDPCSCSYQQVAVPTTSYMLRAQNCPVQSWSARCVQEPVTVQQKVCYWQPQTTCCSTTMGAPIPMGGTPPPITQPMQPTQPPVTVVPSITKVPPEMNQPKVDATITPPGGGSSSFKPKMWDQIYENSWKPQLQTPVVDQPAPPSPPVKLDRISVAPDSHVEGQVVRSDNSPKANARLMFINAGTGQRQTILANTAGRFHVELAPGSWHVYLHGADGIAVHHSRIDVNGAQPRQVNLVSRSN